MMHLASSVSATLNLSLAVATVDHGLRDRSAHDAAFVKTKALELGLACTILEWQGVKPTTGIQEMAREARYDLLTGEARKIAASHLMTAHTLDDQAETILFRMARGSGLNGLVGMRACVERDGIVHSRPLLALPKQRLIETCKAHSVPFLEDVSNANPLFARARWRALMPVLAAEGLTPARLQQLSLRLARADAALRTRAETVSLAAARGISNAEGFDAAIISAEPIEIVIRIIALLIERFKGELSGRDYTFRHVSLSRLEAMAEALQDAILAGQPLRRTLAGLAFSHDRGILKIEWAAPRRSLKPVIR